MEQGWDCRSAEREKAVDPRPECVAQSVEIKTIRHRQSFEATSNFWRGENESKDCKKLYAGPRAGLCEATGRWSTEKLLCTRHLRQNAAEVRISAFGRHYPLPLEENISLFFQEKHFSPCQNAISLVKIDRIPQQQNFDVANCTKEKCHFSGRNWLQSRYFPRI